MAKAKNTKEFIKKAKEVWADEYDYSRVDFKDYDTEVIIVCRKEGHEESQIKPKYHLNRNRPTGCRKCGRERQIEKATKTFEDFLRESREIHGNLYEYDEESYKGSRKNMIIICKKDGHGPFPQTPDAHINQKHGCRKCRNELTGERSRLKYDEVLIRLNDNSRLNNTKVSFDENEYSGINAQLIIKCSKHGVQEPRLVNSMFNYTHPCIECTTEIIGASNKKITKENVVKLLNEKFENKYEIYDFEYEDRRTYIKLNCPIEGHGDFEIQVRGIRRSPGCPNCSREDSQSKRTEGLRKQIKSSRKFRELKWIEEVEEIHGDLYDYSLVHYITARKPVIIICLNHGEMIQTPGTHKKSGCRLCADEDLKGKYTKKYFEDYADRKDRNATLYYIKFTYKDEIFYKVGITTTSINARFSVTNKIITSIDTV